ncbi:hypothetical protein DL89DRAFT_316837 [Linderina pennispora]|uniref:GATA-type domain-containing protein n=1 Tax=Linderina pennispora TaxID=61395 RepID=A0A1Y1W7C7_9FUNG|nr:uncharacterized protein DL89DRAFT_316837 [Linderina pennispora]ORX69447.1 hypothetical protein DL89DRAFT_316837 [Linderina pennispora]
MRRPIDTIACHTAGTGNISERQVYSEDYWSNASLFTATGPIPPVDDAAAADTAAGEAALPPASEPAEPEPAEPEPAEPEPAESDPTKRDLPFPYIPPAFSTIPSYYLIGLLDAYRAAGLTYCTAAKCVPDAPHKCKFRLKGGLSCLSPIDPRRRQLSPSELEDLQRFEESAAKVPLQDDHGGEIKMCSHCCTIETSTWRRSPRDGSSVCNSCGLALKTHGRDRKIILKPTGEFFVERVRKCSRRKAIKRLCMHGRQHVGLDAALEHQVMALSSEAAGLAGPVVHFAQEAADIPYISLRQMQMVEAAAGGLHLNAPLQAMDMGQQTANIPGNVLGNMPGNVLCSMAPQFTFSLDGDAALLHHMITTGQTTPDYSMMQFAPHPTQMMALAATSLPVSLISIPPLTNTLPAMTSPLQQDLQSARGGTTSSSVDGSPAVFRYYDPMPHYQHNMVM